MEVGVAQHQPLDAFDHDTRVGRVYIPGEYLGAFPLVQLVPRHLILEFADIDWRRGNSKQSKLKLSQLNHQLLAGN